MSDEGWGRRTRSGIVWSAASFAGGKVFTFISTLILARLLAPEAFGVVAAILIYLELIELCSDLGMKANVVYEQEQGTTRRIHSAFTVNLLLAGSLTVVGVLCAPLVAAFFDMPQYVDLFRLGALNVVLTGLGNIHDSLLLRDLDFRRRIRPQLARAGTRGLVSIVLVVFFGLEASALVIGLLAGTLVWAAYQWGMTRFRPRLVFDRAIVRSMAAYGTGAALLEVISVLATRADAAIIGSVLGATALGLYTVAYRIPELLIENVTWTVSVVAFPALTKKRALEEQGLAEATLGLLRYQALYAFPVAAGLAVLSAPLIVVLFGGQWTAAGGVMAAAAVTAALNAVSFPLGDVFKATGRQPLLVLINGVELPLIIGVVLLAAPAGIVAVAWSITAVAVLHLVLTVFFVQRQLKIRFAAVARASGPALATGAGVALGAGVARLLWIDDLTVLPVLVGGVLAAVGGLTFLRGLAPVTMRELTRALGELRPSRREAFSA